jgi:PAS domain S-box-containing protein
MAYFYPVREKLSPANAFGHLPACFEHSLVYYFAITDASGAIQYSNKVFRELWHPEAFPDISLAFDKKEAASIPRLMKAVIETGIPQKVDLYSDESLQHIGWELGGYEENGRKLISWIGHKIASGHSHDLDVAQPSPQAQLQKSELFYRNLIADSLDGILLTNEEGIIEFVSPSVKSILGYDQDEILGRSAFEFVHPDDREEAIKRFEEEVNMNPVVKSIHTRLTKKDGSYAWCIVRGHNLMNNPYVEKMAIYFTDDSLGRNAEQALVEGQKALQRQGIILNNVTDVIVTTDLDRVVTSWNKVIEKLSGITSAEAIGRPYRQVLETNYAPYTQEQVADIVFREGIWKGEVSFKGFDGERKQLLHTVSIMHDESGERIGLLGVGKDITERKKIEERLQHSESFYRNLAANSLDGVLMTDARGIIKYCGPSVIKISGHEFHEMLGHSMFEFVHQEDRARALSFFLSSPESDTSNSYINLRLWHASRGWTWAVVRGHNLLNDPTFNAIIIYFADDSKRKQIELQLTESENRFRKLVNSLSQGIIMHNDKQQVILYNPATLKILGVTGEELQGSHPTSFSWKAIFEDGSECSPENTPAAIAFQTGKPVSQKVIGITRQDNGMRAWTLVSAEPLFDQEGKTTNVIISFADITEQKRLSQELFDQEVQRQRLLTQATIDAQEKERQEIGKELHDNINQHLTTTRLYLEVAKEKASGEILEMISLAHQNLADIVSEIRHLSQSLVPPTLGDLGLIESVIELGDSLKRAHSFQVDLQFRHFNEEHLPGNMKLMIFRIIQEQVSNILKHAQASSMKVRLQSDAEYIVVTISDDGKGFNPSQVKRGMGFHNISSRASLFNGRVDIHSTPSNGCTVTVVIPQVASSPASD